MLMIAVNNGNEILANRDIKFVVCLRETHTHLSTSPVLLLLRPSAAFR